MPFGYIAITHFISIHAPREGSDCSTLQRTSASCTFLSTLPARGATRATLLSLFPRLISIHAPREGSDLLLPCVSRTLERFLSTLPARGATDGCARLGYDHGYFYPRSPRGERQQRCTAMTALGTFLSTLPARGATRCACPAAVLCAISIHAPREGSDNFTERAVREWVNFYPRSPRGERRAVRSAGRAEHQISIHAPREGSDRILGDLAPLQLVISIHAPREGSDSKCAEK